jgi:uncharacterized protein
MRAAAASSCRVAANLGHVRNPSDLPPRSTRSTGEAGRRVGDRGRVVLIVVAVVLAVLAFSGRFLAGFYTDYLWHQSVGRTDVFWDVLVTKAEMFALFGGTFVLIAVLNLIIADRLAPTTFAANTHPVVERFHEFFGHRMRTFRIVIAALLGLMFSLPAIGEWQNWLMFRNAKSFGIADAEFGNDVGFYLFRLPFLTFLLDWLFVAMLIITMLVVATHVLNGGIVLQPPRPKLRRSAKGHIAILLALLALVKAGDYWLHRYELTTADRGIVRGATYAVANAQLPATVLLALIAVAVAVLFLSTLKTDRWQIPVTASALWLVVALVGGVIYPAVIQALVVNPNQQTKEAEFIARNVTATRHALGIDNVQTEVITVGGITAAELNDDVAPLQDLRLLDPVIMRERFRADEGTRGGLTINDLDIDRFEVDGRVRQVVVGARELALDKIANTSWQGRHLISTHGCGLVYAPAGQVQDNGRPNYLEADLDRPQLYFSDFIESYAIVKTEVVEQACPTVTDPKPYDGTGGVQLNSFFKRLAYALEYLDYNMVGSSAINEDSRVLSVRRVQDRVQKVAPFLRFDRDPYPVEIDGGVVWIVDGYTTSDRYPSAQRADTAQLDATSGLTEPFNYIRNSVKAVVDAYDGSITLHIVDPTDPAILVWQSAFPKLFEPLEAMSPELREHLRYPEELFLVQTAAYAKYQLSAERFFDRDGLWSVAQAPAKRPTVSSAVPTGTATADDGTAPVAAFATESGSARFTPYYSMFRAPGEDEASFQLFRPFVPFSLDDQRRELQSFMTVSSDPETYGRMVSYVVEGELPDGPGTVAANVLSDSVVSPQISLLNQNDSLVFFGDMQMVPVGGGVLWVRPLYVQPESVEQPSFRKVVASYEGRVALGDSLGEAIGRLFPGFDASIGDVVGAEPSTPSEPSNPPDPGVAETPAELLQQAEALFAEADEALSNGSLAEYERKTQEAREKVVQALELLDAGG